MPYGEKAPLQVRRMLKPILENYDAHVDNFKHFLRTKVACKLVYRGPFDVHQHIREKSTYACSVEHIATGKVLPDVFPVMIGSTLDVAIRHRRQSDFEEVVAESTVPEFEKLDIGRGFFIISGFLRQLPYFFTNDPSRTHIQEGSAVCIFTYDTLDRGKKLSYYTHPQHGKPRGHMSVTHNDGSENSDQLYSFFDFCPYQTHSKTYMASVYRRNQFDIDSLTNKFVISPGHLFTKLFVKYLYAPLRQRHWADVRKALVIVTKSIESGSLLHVLSRKTTFQKEGGTKLGKMTPTTVPLTLPEPQQQREIGADGEVFVEKSIGCYREVNMQTYPLNPFLNYMIVRQISSKVKADSLIPYHPSYRGFLCILGCFETKNVGRTSMMVRDTVVSTCNALDPVFHDAKQAPLWDLLRVRWSNENTFFVVVNEASISVTQACFEAMDLLALKRALRTVECYVDGRFVHITYKMGLFFKPLPGTDVWVTPKDILYWSSRLAHLDSMESLVSAYGFPFLTSYHTDLNPFFNYNHFPKNILAFNALKNAVLAMDNTYHLYFMDSLSAYAWQPSEVMYHQTVQDPEDDGISRFFELKVPKMLVTYMNFEGSTQEDSIVCRKDVTAFYCRRFFSFRVRLEADGHVRFRPAQGDVDDHHHPLMGTLVHFGETPLVVEPFSIHVSVRRVTPQTVQLLLRKTPFRVIHWCQTTTMLTVCVEQDHVTSTGDKVCTFHGQKGVMTLVDKLPLLDGSVAPDLIVNPYCLFRMTWGQMEESRRTGGRDSVTLQNVDGQQMEPGRALYGHVFYFPISYWAVEHFYAPRQCTMDKIYNQPVKGRSRCGGMRLGNMELLNGLRAHGLAACFETKFFEHGDRVPSAGTASLPKSVELVQQDSCYFKCQLKYTTQPSVRIGDHSKTRLPCWAGEKDMALVCKK